MGFELNLKTSSAVARHPCYGDGEDRYRHRPPGVCGRAWLSHDGRVSVGGTLDLFRDRGKGKAFGLGSAMLEIRPKYLETQSKGDRM